MNATETVDMTPTFEQACNMLAAVLTGGTPQGQQEAAAELAKYGRMLDEAKAGLNRIHGESRDPATVAMVNEIAKRMNEQ